MIGLPVFTDHGTLRFPVPPAHLHQSLADADSINSMSARTVCMSAPSKIMLLVSGSHLKTIRKAYFLSVSYTAIRLIHLNPIFESINPSVAYRLPCPRTWSPHLHLSQTLPPLRKQHNRILLVMETLTKMHRQYPESYAALM
jgi:hypothetical protein